MKARKNDGDLISKKALMEDFQHTITAQSDTFDWLNMIERQPIAYDIEKVVEKLDKVSEHYDCDNAPNGMDSNMLFLADAIEIVKGGEKRMSVADIMTKDVDDLADYKKTEMTVDEAINVLVGVLKVSKGICGENSDCDDCPCYVNDGDCLSEPIKTGVEALKFQKEKQAKVQNCIERIEDLKIPYSPGGTSEVECDKRINFYYNMPIDKTLKIIKEEMGLKDD